MKKIKILSALFLALVFQATYAQQMSNTGQKPTEFKVVTVVESIVPMGLGRSRIIDSQTQVDASNFTTERTDGKKSNQNEIERGKIKVDELEETKLLNFFSATGINFQNIASNDAVIASKINSMLMEGWNLTYVTSGVESDAGADDGQGIFVTRLFFSR
ncbi:hypothetical protein OU792_16540 [Algoriphagus sp. NF]|jgi:hypothetical protein|uniref:Uncharacterized protein n=1 Tax=Algoriphagus marincola TaxID=264027 RepID=A0ABS7N952_9BACT|nr:MULTISPECIES: hypothetical protein [Algoriphagus]MBY5952873.1 hypothetical protein [Algoriphagus marincola]MDE0561608.1 hypothetical protein [Algoriphagus sp. NF]